MENRSIFALDGITGLLVATILLIAIEGILVFFAIGAQGSVSQDYSYFEDAKGVKMFGSSTEAHMKLLKDK